MSARGRFAPTPSGRLHVGSARTAIAAELAARAVGGAFVLRVEDLDLARTKPGATALMLDDLRWLGLRWDEGPDVGGPFAPYLQSERSAMYRDALDQLRARGFAYPCLCSRREVDLATQAPHGAEPVYPGTCAKRDADAVLREARERGRSVCWRFRSRSGLVTVNDQVMGVFAQDVAAEVGDFVIHRADGVAAYQLAVVVDDIAMGMDQVVRGADLLASTPRQVLLYEALGAPPPRAYLHVPLVVDANGERLAKRNDSIAISVLRARGVSAERVRDALIESLGARDGFAPARVPTEPYSLATMQHRVPEVV